jgi:SAM-dependent methyltransferase
MKCSSTPPLYQQMRRWYESSLGKLLAQTEQSALDRILPNLFGYHLLQVGCNGRNLLAASRILHKVAMVKVSGLCGRVSLAGPLTEQVSSQLNIPLLAGDPEKMPILTDSIDAVILYHTLEFAHDPHQVLREAERILVPEGHIVMLVFNPFSLWGLRRLIPFGRGALPWCGRFMSLLRLKDWLALLGFEIISTEPLFFRPPLNQPGIQSRLSRMEKWGGRWWSIFGAVHMVVARKKVSTITPIKPRWTPQRNLSSRLADTASRSYERNGRSN